MLCSRYRCSEDEMRSVVSPESTDTWSPISHGTMVDIVVEQLKLYGLKVWKAEFGMNKLKTQMFGVLDLQLPHGLYQKDMTMSIGLRNSIDKSLAASVCLGNRVFVCDNLGFSGEVQLVKKHRKRIEWSLRRSLESTVEGFISRFQDTDLPQIAVWKQIPISYEFGTEFICKLAEYRIIPHSGILRCRQLFQNPKYPELEQRTAWGLYNAITTFQRDERQESSPTIVQEQMLGLWKSFSREFTLAT